MEIFKLKNDDLNKAVDLVLEVFNEFEAPEYSEEGIAEFGKFVNYQSIKERISSGELVIYGCRVNGKIAGLLALKNFNHISLLFVKKEYHRQGIAKSLFKYVKGICKEHNEFKVTVNSSPYAVEVYRRLGFTETDKEKTVNGIRFTPMMNVVKN